MTILEDSDCYPHFTDDKTEALKDELPKVIQLGCRDLVQTHVSEKCLYLLTLYYIYQFNMAEWLNLVE